MPESLACGKPVLLNYKRDQHIWCYGEPPPCINADSDEAVEARVNELLDNDAHRTTVGREGFEWFTRHHSTRVVAERHIDVYRAVADRLGWNWSG